MKNKTPNGSRDATAAALVACCGLAALLCVSCRHPAPQPAASVGDRLAGRYTFSTADLNIELVLRADWTSYASMDRWAEMSGESGAWTIAADVVVLRPESGGLAVPIHRLRLDRQSARDVLRMVDPDSQPDGLISAITLGRVD
jgi:hypothetical protein